MRKIYLAEISWNFIVNYTTTFELVKALSEVEAEEITRAHFKNDVRGEPKITIKKMLM
jgi:hypothetical protein